jgi:hypothetical protein
VVDKLSTPILGFAGDAEASLGSTLLDSSSKPTDLSEIIVEEYHAIIRGQL